MATPQKNNPKNERIGERERIEEGNRIGDGEESVKHAGVQALFPGEDPVRRRTFFGAPTAHSPATLDENARW